MKGRRLWKKRISPKAQQRVKNTKRLSAYKIKGKYIPLISPKYNITSGAYQGEIRRKVEGSKRRKLQSPKKISLATFKQSYGSTNFISAYSNKVQKAFTTTGSRTSLVQSNNYRKYVLYFKKKAWYTDKAAPIPGGNPKLSTGFARKQKFYKKIFRAYRLFKTYQTFNKKRLNKQYRKRVRPCFNLAMPVSANSMEFSILMHMDSLFHSSMRKSSFILNPQRVFGSCFLNGKYATKKGFVLYRRNKAFQKDGDFCSCLSSKG